MIALSVKMLIIYVRILTIYSRSFFSTSEAVRKMG